MESGTNNANLVLVTPGALGSLQEGDPAGAIEVNTIAPGVSSIAFKAGTVAGTYGVGATLIIHVTYSLTVKVEGGTPPLTMPQLHLDLGGGVAKPIDCVLDASKLVLVCSLGVVAGDVSGALDYSDINIQHITIF